MDKRTGWMTAGIVLLFRAATPAASTAQTFTALVRFTPAEGIFPGYVELSQGTDGNLYGTTSENGPKRYGSFFGVTPGGALTVRYGFDGSHGRAPFAGVILARDGNFYGTTEEGGANNGAPHRGTIFKITPGGALTILHTFDTTDGTIPYAPLVQAMDGELYGTTAYGGPPNNGCFRGSCGTIFKITPGGNFTMLHAFGGGDGANPYNGLIQAADGSFYGTTYGGGANACAQINGGGCGTVFKIPSGGAFTVLHNFDGTDGSGSFAGLVQGTDGNFYGTTAFGGAYGYGTVFKITPERSFTTLYSFPSNGGPMGTLIQATDGNFYGTTAYGGTIFSITPDGALTTLYTLGYYDGASPYGLVQATDGNFYGITDEGYGTVFKLSTGLGPFVKTVSTSGKVGDAIIILGTSLTSATGVTFNGIAADFTVGSASEISTTVPAGATTGKVQVTTPGGTLLSNVAFHVRQ